MKIQNPSKRFISYGMYQRRDERMDDTRTDAQPESSMPPQLDYLL